MNKEILKTGKSSNNHIFGYVYLLNKSKDKHGFLYESYGILEYNNDAFKHSISQFVHNIIIPLIKQGNITYDSDIPDISDNVSFKKLILHCDLSWIKDVYVFITEDKNIPDMTLSSLYYDQNKKCNFPIIVNGKEIPSYSLSGSFIDYMSIVLNIDNTMSEEYICGIINHEMKHGYDMIKDNFVANNSNRDIIYFRNISHSINDSYITKYWEYSDKEQEDFLKSLNADEIFSLFCDMMYYLNLSEIQARLNNFSSEIDYVNKYGHSSDFGNDTIKLYQGLANILSGLKRYTVEKVKMEFSEKYANHFETVYSEDSDNPNKQIKHFSVRGKYGGESFHKIINFYIHRINHYFFRHAKQIWFNKINKDFIFDIYDWKTILKIIYANRD